MNLYCGCSQLSFNYRELAALKSLLAGLALPQQETQVDCSGDSLDVALSPLRTDSPLTLPQLQPIQNRLQNISSVDSKSL